MKIMLEEVQRLRKSVIKKLGISEHTANYGAESKWAKGSFFFVDGHLCVALEGEEDDWITLGRRKPEVSDGFKRS